jgi:hypothetical protein
LDLFLFAAFNFPQKQKSTNSYDTIAALLYLFVNMSPDSHGLQPPPTLPLFKGATLF